jgi:hypothetical protein
MSSSFHWVIVGSVGGGVVVAHISTPQGMTYEAAQKLANEINTMYAMEQGEHNGFPARCASTHPAPAAEEAQR